MKALVIGGVASGSGKTSVTLGLVAALRRRGLVVQTYKVGPDFLDPTYLKLVSGRDCFNLDLWMTGEQYVRDIFFSAAADKTGGREADVCIIEGVMGLYDGIFSGEDFGSTACIARILGIPVFLLASCRSMARSFAALVSGFINFTGAPEFAAIGANMAGSHRHGEVITEALTSIAGLPPYAGTLIRGALPTLPSRHLGLVSADQEVLSAEVISCLAEGIEEAFDIDLLLKNAKEFELPAKCDIWQDAVSGTGYRIGVALDEAFHFYYPDNLRALAAHGCEILPFSPLKDAVLPPELDAVYIGGGYPECMAERLSANTTMLESIREFAASGKMLYAECGGLMYMSEAIITAEKTEYEMCGVFPAKVMMLERFKTLGYVEADILEDNILGRVGTNVRGHEYHYSELVGGIPEGWECSYSLSFGRDMKAEPRKEGFAKNGVLVSYLHANFAANRIVLKSLLDSIGRRK